MSRLEGVKVWNGEIWAGFFSRKRQGALGGDRSFEQARGFGTCRPTATNTQKKDSNTTTPKPRQQELQKLSNSATFGEMARRRFARSCLSGAGTYFGKSLPTKASPKFRHGSLKSHFSPPVRWGLLDFMSVSSPPPRPRPPSPPSPPRRLPSPCPVASLCVQCGMSDLNCDPVSSVWRAGLQPRSCECSVAYRTPTAILRVQCGVPDPNRDPANSVWRPGPQPRSCEFSVASRTPTAILWVQCGVPDLKYCVRKFVRKNDRRYVRKNDRRYVRRNVKKICQKICQKECQKICQKICQKECQKICQKECQKICQKEW